jgi:RNA polymerase sigma factor (sigma-70 family)
MQAPDDFTVWYEREHPRVLAAMTVAAGDVEVACEVTDEAFARALERWARVREMGSPGGWTHVTALNVLRRRARRASLERTLLQRRPSPSSTVPPSLAPPVWDAVRALPDRMRTAVALRYIADLPEDEIADAMGVTRGTVASTLHRARERLSGALDPDGYPRHSPTRPAAPRRAGDDATPHHPTTEVGR